MATLCESEAHHTITKHDFFTISIATKMIIESSLYVWNHQLCSIWPKSKLSMFILIFKTKYIVKTNSMLNIWHMWHPHGIIQLD
jgi:hypothetical protein